MSKQKQMDQDTYTCRYCGIEIDGLDEGTDHHIEEHPHQRFDPVWYTKQAKMEASS